MFTVALEREEDHRGIFLDEACRGDDELRTEVDSLLASAQAADGFFGELSRGIGPPKDATMK